MFLNHKEVYICVCVYVCICVCVCIYIYIYIYIYKTQTCILNILTWHQNGISWLNNIHVQVCVCEFGHSKSLFTFHLKEVHRLYGLNNGWIVKCQLKLWRDARRQFHLLVEVSLCVWHSLNQPAWHLQHNANQNMTFHVFIFIQYTVGEPELLPFVSHPIADLFFVLGCR